LIRSRVRSVSPSISASSVRAMSARNFSSGSSTYYDSQSGMEVPINNEDEISVFFDNSRNELGGSTRSGPDDMTLEQILEDGYQGVLLPPNRTQDALAMGASSVAGVGVGVGFTLFVDSRRLEDTIRYPDHVNTVFECIDDSSSSLQKRLAAHVDNGTKTSIGLFNLCCYHRDPILVASEVATLIDKTGGGDFIWVQPKPKNEDLGGEVEGEDSIIDLCQQLSYLDVAGPTIKSRLIVTANSEYQVEECLNIGVNKFAVHHPNSVKWLCGMVEEEGKQIKLAVSIP
jgi:hypothetical protein